MVKAIGRDQRVAVIDDEERMRDAVEGLVRSIGLEAVGFESADSFLAGAEGGDFGCIVADIQMPGLSGLDLQQTLSARGDDTPFVFITGLPRDDLLRRSVEAANHCCLNKPFEPDELIGCVKEALAVPG